MRSVMQHNFSQVPKAEIQRSVFNRSCGLKTTFDSGYLVPFFCDEVLPGDTFKLRLNHLVRLTTPIVPVMDNVFLETFFFFVPDRLVWSNFERLMGAQDDPGDSTDYLFPQISIGKADAATYLTPGSIFDYFGVPPFSAASTDDIKFDARPFRAYNLIYNSWFRDENLCNSLDVEKGDGPDAATKYALVRRGKRHDYFTSCLPWPQKGPGVELPLGTTAPVVGNGVALGLTDGSTGYSVNSLSSGSVIRLVAAHEGYGAAVGATSSDVTFPTTNILLGVSKDADYSGLVADLSEATAASINSLRQAFQIQRLLEADARGGTRYSEIILSHYGVKSPDARLQRPEYLGGSSDRIHTYPVAQTASTDATTPQGNLAAYGVSTGADRVVIDKSFVEHGWIIGLINVRADLTYQQGLPRMLSRRTRYDVYWPTLAHLGEQAVLNKEIYYQGKDSDDNAVFGYQERWAEYRYKPSQITGKMRSQISGSLDVWHLSQEFESLPVLNAEFIADDPPIKRLLAVQDEPEFFGDFYFDYVCYRPMPAYSVPGLIDHF